MVLLVYHRRLSPQSTALRPIAGLERPSAGYEAPNLTLVAIGAFFPVSTNLVAGIRQIDRTLVEVGRAYGLRGPSLVAGVLVPASLPSLPTGPWLGPAQGWLVLVAAELIAAWQGLGFLPLDGSNTSRVDISVLALILLALLGKTSDWGPGPVEHRLPHWSDPFEGGASVRANPMRSDDDPPDVSYRFDERLREVPNDPVGMARAVAEFEARLAAGVSDPGERMRALGTLGGYRRILGRLDAAEATLREAVALAQQIGNGRALLANEIRLAHVLQWQERFAQADALFAAAVARCEASPKLAGLLSFALQHAGNSLFDQGRDAEAAERFARALSLREGDGDPELIASSRLALVAARARLTG